MVWLLGDGEKHFPFLLLMAEARRNQQLYEAAENGNFEEIEHLLSLHPDIDVNWKNNEKV